MQSLNIIVQHFPRSSRYVNDGCINFVMPHMIWLLSLIADSQSVQVVGVMDKVLVSLCS